MSNVGIGTVSNVDLEKIQMAIRVYGRQQKLARDLGVSDSYVSAVYTGKKTPSDKLLDAVGMTRRVVYSLSSKALPKGETE